MLLHDAIVSAYEEGFSGIYVKCNTPTEAAQEFEKLFKQSYEQALDDAEEFYDAPCMEKEEKLDCPISTKTIDDTTCLIQFGPLYLSINDGVRADNDYLTNAVENTLAELQKIVPGVTYYGMIAYPWYDEHCGDVVVYEISSDSVDTSNRTYPFVKDIFKEILEDEDAIEDFMENFEDNIYQCDEEEANEIIDCFKQYELPEEFMERIQELLEEFLED